MGGVWVMTNAVNNAELQGQLQVIHRLYTVVKLSTNTTWSLGPKSSLDGRIWLLLPENITIPEMNQQ